MPDTTLSITLPDKLAEEINAASAAVHKDVSEFVRDALQQVLDEDKELSAEDWAAIERGRAEIKAGNYVSLENLDLDRDD